MSETDPIPNDHTSKPGADGDSTPLDHVPTELTEEVTSDALGG